MQYVDATDAKDANEAAKHLPPEPLLILRVVYDEEDKTVKLLPSPEEVKEKLVELTMSTVDALELKTTESELISNCVLTQKKLYQPPKTHVMMTETTKVVESIVDDMFEKPQQSVAEKFQQYVYLFDEPEDIDVRDLRT